MHMIGMKTSAALGYRIVQLIALTLFVNSRLNPCLSLPVLERQAYWTIFVLDYWEGEWLCPHGSQLQFFPFTEFPISFPDSCWCQDFRPHWPAPDVTPIPKFSTYHENKAVNQHYTKDLRNMVRTSSIGLQEQQLKAECQPLLNQMLLTICHPRIFLADFPLQPGFDVTV